MKILVTGGTVFVSRFTAEYFVNKGHEVFVLNRNTRPQSKGVNLIARDRNALGDCLKKHYFDLVIDVSAYTQTDVKNLCGALGGFGKYVFISSSAVYPETLPQPFKEEYACGANSIWGDYGTNKLAAENFLLESVENLCIIRPPYLYGPMNNIYREAFIFDCAERNRPFYLPADGSMPLQFFHIEDLCKFIERISERELPHKIYNVGNLCTVTVAEWVKLCYSIVGKTPEFIKVNGHKIRDYFCFVDYSYKLYVTRQSEVLSQTKPLTVGFKESYQWYAANREGVRKKNYFEYIDKYIK